MESIKIQCLWCPQTFAHQSGQSKHLNRFHSEYKALRKVNRTEFRPTATFDFEKFQINRDYVKQLIIETKTNEMYPSGFISCIINLLAGNITLKKGKIFYHQLRDTDQNGIVHKQEASIIMSDELVSRIINVFYEAAVSQLSDKLCSKDYVVIDLLYNLVKQYQLTDEHNLIYGLRKAMEKNL